MLFILVLTFQEYTCFSVTRLRLMRQLHRFEYSRHVCSTLSLHLAQVFSIAYGIIGFFALTLTSACVESEMSYLDVHDLPAHDICSDFFTSARSLTPDRACATYLGFILAELLPFVFYFWLNEPHDCFQCLGKDPDRRFSIFQLTRRENLIRQLQVKFGTGAFGVAGNLTASQTLSEHELEQHLTSFSIDGGSSSGFSGKLP